MLTSEALYPYPGSYALYVDLDQPPPQPAELVRTQWRRVDAQGRGFVAVSFPQRDGASGNKVVPADQLIDGTPLSAEEQREFHNLDRELFGREPRNLSKAQRAKAKRRDALKQRTIWTRFMERKLAAVRGQQRWAA